MTRRSESGERTSVLGQLGDGFGWVVYHGSDGQKGGIIHV
jgi:hypothetical protein